MVRSKVRIVSDILETIKTNRKCTKSTVVRLANLDWKMANNYLDTLLDEGFLRTHERVDNRSKEIYDLTDNGEEFLDFLSEVRDKSSIF